MVNYALDACALIALLKKKEGALAINELFLKAKRGEILLVMSVYNLIEVYYGLISELGLQTAGEVMPVITASPLNAIYTVSPFVYHEAARLKGVYHRLSLADAVGLATAADYSARFVTADHHELEIIERNEPIQFFWFR